MRVVVDSAAGVGDGAGVVDGAAHVVEKAGVGEGAREEVSEVLIVDDGAAGVVGDGALTVDCFVVGDGT